MEEDKIGQAERIVNLAKAIGVLKKTFQDLREMDSQPIVIEVRQPLFIGEEHHSFSLKETMALQTMIANKIKKLEIELNNELK